MSHRKKLLTMPPLQLRPQQRLQNRQQQKPQRLPWKHRPSRRLHLN
jgi:hypothetical protein